MSEKTIFIEVHDSVGDIVARMVNAKSDELILVVPRGAVVLQSLINLKLLKSQADKLGKSVILSTEGGLGENLAREAKLEVVETLKPKSSEPETFEQIPALDSQESNEDSYVESLEDSFGDDEEDVEEVSEPTAFQHRPQFRHAKLTVNLDDEQDEEDESFTPRPTPLSNLSWSKVRGMFKKPSLPAVRLRLARHHWIAVWIVLAGALILGSVAYFIIPRAYAAIEVQSEPYKKQFGFVVADQNDLQAAGPNLVTGRYIEVIHENVVGFTATGEQNRGAKAEGKITIINTTGTIQGLLANTRFQAPNGLVYRTKFEILVPPAKGSSAGRAIVDAIADEGGAKYNLPVGTSLTIPGLGAAGTNVVYGEITGAFAGGTDAIVKVVSEDDVNKAKEEAAKNVFTAAEAELTDKLKRGEEIPVGFIQNDIIDALPSVSIGTEQANFDVRVQSRSWVLAVKRGELQDALANAASFEVPEGKQVTARTLEGAKIEVVESNFLTHRINLVVTLDGRIGPKLDTQKIVENVANKSLPAAKEYIQSLENIVSGSIELWPSFISRVPLLHNNIRVQVIYIGE